LAKHPAAFVAQPIIPEPKVCLTAHPDGIAGLRARYAALFDSAPPESIRIEKTSNYFENAEARERLAAVLPTAKFIFILREPVARAYSNWQWSKKNGLETLNFAEAIECEGRRPDPLAPERAYARPFDYMSRGRYATFARAWIDAVGRDRIAFFLFENVVRDPDTELRAVQRFAGLPDLPWARIQTEQVNATQPMPATLPPGLLRHLRAIAEPEVDTFAALTGLDVSAWNYR
jgi:hypothetical protein